MIIFKNRIDIRSRQVKKPQVAKFLKNNNDKEFHYCIIGTSYGHIHTCSGDVRTWKSYSGARKYLVKNKNYL